jgi:hypothetical protein
MYFDISDFPLVSPRGQRESAVLLFQFGRIIRDYPPSPAEGLIPKICSKRSSRSIAALRSNRLADYGSRTRLHVCSIAQLPTEPGRRSDESRFSI